MTQSNPRSQTRPWLQFAASIFLLLGGYVAAAPLTLHVATNGNDNASGALTRRAGDGPLATLEAALAKARAARNPEGVDILLHGGTHRLTKPLVLTPEDSGPDATAPLTLAAFGNARPVLSGGVVLTNWTQLQPNMWQANARQQLGSKGNFRSLFYNGKRATRARTPNENTYYRMEGARTSDKPFQFRFRPGNLKTNWAAAGDVEIVAFEKWTNIRQFIRQINQASNLVTLSGLGSEHTRENGARYFVENASDALDVPGEWRLDSSTGLVTVMCKPGEDPNRMEVVVPRLQELLQFKGEFGSKTAVRHVVLRGLTFADTDWSLASDGYRDTQAAVNIRGDVFGDGMTDCRIENCTFTRLAGYGIDLGRGCQRNRITGNDLFDLGAGGVRVGETSVRTVDFEATHSTTITGNHLHQLGRLYPPAVGVFILQSATNRVAHNHIHDLFYTAVSVGWTWGYRASPCHDNVIESNHMHDVGQGLLSDMGAVYTLGPQPGTVVRNNRIHDVTSFTYGGWGLYTDEGSSGIVLESNVVYRCKSAGFHQHYGRENVVRNNIFAFNKESQLMRSREETHTSFYCSNNIVLFNSGKLLDGTWKNDRFVLDGNLYWDTRVDGDTARMKFNNVSLEQWRARGHDVRSVFADPLFVNAAANDFRLQSNSPAFQLGFEPIDLAQTTTKADWATPGRDSASMNHPRPDRFPHRIWAACDFEGLTPDYGWFGRPETNDILRYPGNVTALSAAPGPYQNFSAVMAGINPVPGPRMGKVNRLFVRYHLTGGSEATFQHFSLTREDNWHIRVDGLEPGRWAQATLDFTRDARRNDGSSEPFVEGERMDDFKVFAGLPAEAARYRLLIDDVIFFANDPALPEEPEPFPNRVILLAAFDTGPKEKYWPGDFELIEQPPPGAYWRAARAVKRRNGNEKLIRLAIEPPRQLGARTKLRFRYHLTGDDGMTVQIFDATVQDNRHVVLRELKQGSWTTCYVDLSRDARRNDGTANSPFAAGHKVDDLFFFLRSEAKPDAELFVDEVVLYDAGSE